ncbi:MAG TPA: LamG-like jellyroll fold domain-containing protein, partial [Candidatus Binatia bacterium]|nr:LamG-like jellyroll fold domain-containing protein [Candidatus Binatia bacterium]
MKSQILNINGGLPVPGRRKIHSLIWLMGGMLVAGLLSVGTVAQAATLNNYFNFVDIGTTNAITNGIGGSVTIADYFGTNATVKSTVTTLNSSGLAIGAGTVAANTGVRLAVDATTNITGDFTFQIWFTSPATLAGNTAVFGGTTAPSVNNDMTSYKGFWCGYNGTPNFIRPIVSNGTKFGADMNGTTAGTGTTPNTLYDYVVTYVSATHTFTAYMNGTQVGTLTVTAFNGLSTLTNGIAVGGVQNPTFGDNAAAVTVSDFLIYSGTLSAPQVTSIHSLGVGASVSSIQTE